MRSSSTSSIPLPFETTDSPDKSEESHVIVVFDLSQVFAFL